MSRLSFIGPQCYLWLLIACGSIYACSKSGTGTGKAAIPPAVANGYLAGGAWVLRGTYLRDPSGFPRFLPDSLVFSFSAGISTQVIADTLKTYFSRIISFDTVAFVFSTAPDEPDTLLSFVSPYTFSGSRLDTFLIKDLSDSMFVLEQYQQRIISAEIDTLRKAP